MYLGSLPAVSNREDWQQAITLTDVDTGELIDISGCDITLTVREFKSKCAVFQGSTAGGEVTLPEDGTFMWNFPASQMNSLCQRQYEVGVRVAQDDRTAQLIIASFDVLEGIDNQ